MTFKNALHQAFIVLASPKFFLINGEKLPLNRAMASPQKNLDSVLILLFVVSERLKLELRPVIGSFDEEKVVFVLTCTRDVARTNYSKQSVRISIAVFIKRRTRYCPKDFLASEPCLNPCCKLKYLGLNPCSAHFARSFLER